MKHWIPWLMILFLYQIFHLNLNSLYWNFVMQFLFELISSHNLMFHMSFPVWHLSFYTLVNEPSLSVGYTGITVPQFFLIVTFVMDRYCFCIMTLSNVGHLVKIKVTDKEKNWSFYLDYTLQSHWKFRLWMIVALKCMMGHGLQPR